MTGDRVHRKRRPRGAALLEVLVGLTIMAWAAASWAALASQVQHSISLLRTREREYELAGEQFDRMSIWTRDQFAAHLGEHRVHGRVVVVEQIGPLLFSATIADSTKGASLLTTTFFVSAEGPNATNNRVAEP